jgi:hypothetical protein
MRGGTTWQITIAAAVWEPVLQTAMIQSVTGASDCATVSGICTGTASALVMNIDSSLTGPTSVWSSTAGPAGVLPIYWSATWYSTIIGSALPFFEGQAVDADRPFYNDLVGRPLVLSCAGIGVPGGGIFCPPTSPLLAEPGVTIGGVNGTTVSAFSMVFSGLCRQDHLPLDWKLEEVPEARTLVLLGIGLVGLAFARRKRVA